jgi:hypothetical protein
MPSRSPAGDDCISELTRQGSIRASSPFLSSPAGEREPMKGSPTEDEAKHVMVEQI